MLNSLSFALKAEVVIHGHFLLQLRFQKCVDAHPEIVQKVTAAEHEKMKEKSDRDKVSCMLIIFNLYLTNFGFQQPSCQLGYVSA